MKIEVKQLERYTKILIEVKELSEEIAKVQRLAEFTASNDVTGHLDLNVKPSLGVRADSDNANTEIKIEAFLDGDMSFMSRMYGMQRGLPLPWQNEMVSKKKDKRNSSSSELSENATLQILGIILCEKQKKMDILIAELKEIGFDIKQWL